MKKNKNRGEKVIPECSSKRKVCGRSRVVLVAAIAAAVGASLSFTIGTLSSFEQDTSEAVIYQSSLVWRQDALGDDILPAISSGKAYELPEAIQTTGKIQSITASWEFTGEATLEVSADNGQNYTAVVCGVPLTEGFVSGNKLKWRAAAGEDSQLSEVRINYTDTSGVIGDFGQPELSGFKYRKPILITNSSASELFNYQLKIEVGEENTEADFQDIRFTCTDGQSLLPYYLEGIRGISPNRIAVFWVKILQLPQGDLPIYVYYGNTQAEDLSRPEAVFDFFDDFDGVQLDLSKWQAATYLEGAYQLNDSLLKLDAAKVISRVFQLQDGIIEYRAKAKGTSGEIRAVIREDKDNSDLTQLAYSSICAGAEHALAIGNIVQENTANAILADVFYDYRVVVEGANLTFERYAQGYGQIQTSVTVQDAVGLKQGYLGLETAGAGNQDRVADYDWIRVRALAVPEPLVKEIGEQEETNLPEFLATEISDNGNLLLSGQYTTETIPAGCQISAVTPVIKVRSSEGQRVKEKDVALEVSADGGETWRSDCLNGQTYNAPKDFARGKELKLRAAGKKEITRVAELEQIGLEYIVGPVVSSKHVRCLGASGRAGDYIKGDSIIIKWDNTPSGDNNPDILAVNCNLLGVGGPNKLVMLDKNKDGVYQVEYKLPQNIEKTGNIFVSATNVCGVTTRDGHILSVDTTTKEPEARLRLLEQVKEGLTLSEEEPLEEAEQEEAAEEEEQEEEPEPETTATQPHLMKRYKIKF
ncbi:MAG: DUF2341 domain-containing protein, partial [Candidatus Omnitrophica bacterium]|nr:DUF2341 domain-containing protein [Candidatus Omnitrophota bacterium]